MKKLGDFWLPDPDVRKGRHLRKSQRLFEAGQGPKIADLEEALGYVQRWTVAVDGGANVGAYTRVMMRRFACVHAFEPAPDVFAALSRNISEWNGEDRVQLHPNALSDRRESVSLSTRWWRRTPSRRVMGGGSIAALRIDDLDLPDLAFLKLDVEGYEERALRGAEKTILRFHPVIMVEDRRQLSARYGDPQGTRSYLRSLGAEQWACVGPKQFDYVYGFGRSAPSGLKSAWSRR